MRHVTAIDLQHYRDYNSRHTQKHDTHIIYPSTYDKYASIIICTRTFTPYTTAQYKRRNRFCYSELFASGTVTQCSCGTNVCDAISASTPQLFRSARTSSQRIGQCSQTARTIKLHLPHYYFSKHKGSGLGKRSGQEKNVTHSQIKHTCVNTTCIA